MKVEDMKYLPLVYALHEGPRYLLLKSVVGCYPGYITKAAVEEILYPGNGQQENRIAMLITKINFEIRKFGWMIKKTYVRNPLNPTAMPFLRIELKMERVKS